MARLAVQSDEWTCGEKQIGPPGIRKADSPTRPAGLEPATPGLGNRCWTLLTAPKWPPRDRIPTNDRLATAYLPTLEGAPLGAPLAAYPFGYSITCCCLDIQPASRFHKDSNGSPSVDLTGPVLSASRGCTPVFNAPLQLACQQPDVRSNICTIRPASLASSECSSPAVASSILFLAISSVCSSYCLSGLLSWPQGFEEFILIPSSALTSITLAEGIAA